MKLYPARLCTLTGLFLALCLFSCHQKDNPNFEKSLFTVTNEASQLQISFNRTAANPNILEAIHAGEEERLLRVVNAEFAHNKTVYSRLVNFQINEGAKKSYLIFQGYSQKAQTEASFAYEIQLNKDKTNAGFVLRKSLAGADGRSEMVATESHSCTGAPCSCCSFLMDGGTIIGCKCDQVLNTSAPCYGAPGYCNHTIGTGTVPPFGQCGGIGWTGPTICEGSYLCQAVNPYYSQCVPF